MTGEIRNVIGEGARVGHVVQGHTFTGDISMGSAGITIHPAPDTEPPVFTDYAALTCQLRSLAAALAAGEQNLISGQTLDDLREACIQLAAVARQL